MINDIQHIIVTIEMDRWLPFDRECQLELDDLLLELKGRRLLAHFGNVKTTMRQI